MEILSTLRPVALALLGLSLLGTACKKKGKDAPPQATLEQCEELCEKIKVCNDAIYAPKGVAKTRIAKRALRFYKNKKKCLRSCKGRIKRELKQGKKLGRERFFIAHQVSCVKGSTCQEFAECQQKSFKKAVREYPLDAVTAQRCESVCQRRHKCVAQILPRSLGKKFTSMPEDKKAEAMKKWADLERCRHTCRYNHIKGPTSRPGVGSIAKSSNEGFFMEFAVYLNCIGHKDCGAFAQCAAKQMPGR